MAHAEIGYQYQTTLCKFIYLRTWHAGVMISSHSSIGRPDPKFWTASVWQRGCHLVLSGSAQHRNDWMMDAVTGESCD